MNMSGEEYKDVLTGGLNRKGFIKRAQSLLLQYPDTQYACLYTDIVHFKLINEAFGYDAGDALLCEWSRAFRESLTEDEAFGRNAADHFMALIRYDEDGFFERIENFYNQLSHFLDEKDKHFKIEFCSGIYVVLPEDRENPNIVKMMDYARMAQQTIKRKGGGITFFNQKHREQQWRNMKISGHLEDALKNHEILLYLQPQYNFFTKEMFGAEVLCRWNHEELGMIYPGEFIPLLEKTNQVYKLDYYVWEQACALLSKWRGQKKRFSVSVNISREDIRQDDIVEVFCRLVEKYKLPIDSLHLEITESAYMEEPKQLIELVRRLRQRGFVVEMDDFGSGYSSLNMLKEVPVNILKIDLRFLQGEDEYTRSGIILGSILKMAHQLELPVICEGVETLDQANFMKNLGCSMMQGYYFAKPMPVEAFEKLLCEQKTGSVAVNSRVYGLQKMNELLDAKSNSAFLFERCIGGAALVKYYNNICEPILINDDMYREIGIDRSFDLYIRNLFDIMTLRSRETAVRTLNEAIAHGNSKCELQIEQNKQWISVRFNHVSIGDKGNIFLLTVENVTESHRLQKQLRDLHEELEAHMKLMPGGVFRYEAEGEQEFVYISESMLHMLGYPTQEAFREKFHNRFPDMVYQEDRERVLKEIDDQIANGTYDYCLYRIEAADGTLKKIYDKGHIVEDDDGNKYFYVIVIDITEDWAVVDRLKQ